MLKRLTINNYALIEALDINFPDGLIIITGETGAGKSILLGALSLLLGSKADISILKNSDKNCIVEGEFYLKGACPQILQTNGYQIEGGTLILRRVVSPSGRSRSFINDEPVANSLLSDISNNLIDIHAQHQHLLLTDNNYQLLILDYFAGNAKLLKEYKDTYNTLKTSKDKLHKMDSEIAKSQEEVEFKQFQLNKLNDAGITDGELNELETEQKMLANAEEIKDSLNKTLNLLLPAGQSIVQNLKEASQLLSKYASFDQNLSELSARLESCRIECKDIENEIEKISGDIEISPERLITVENRIGEIYLLLRKHNCTNEQELINIKNQLANDLESTEIDIEVRDNLAKEVIDLKNKLNLLANELTQKRTKEVSNLSKILEAKIRELDMPYARFFAELTTGSNCNESGKETIRFMFSANGDNNLNELSKVASGGELSRIMLCLKSMMAKYTGMPTMIFDEIDTGVSGKIADKMGKLIGELGEVMQIFAITHLPQIASKGKTHLLVYKEFNENKRAKTDIKSLNNSERIMEIARLLSGENLSEAAIENAKYLLKNNIT